VHVDGTVLRLGAPAATALGAIAILIELAYDAVDGALFGAAVAALVSVGAILAAILASAGDGPVAVLVASTAGCGAAGGPGAEVAGGAVDRALLGVAVATDDERGAGLAAEGSRPSDGTLVGLRAAATGGAAVGPIAEVVNGTIDRAVLSLAFGGLRSDAARDATELSSGMSKSRYQWIISRAFSAQKPAGSLIERPYIFLYMSMPSTWAPLETSGIGS
jgi:hypothetical protein